MRIQTIQTNTVRVSRTRGSAAAFIMRLPLLACFSLAISASATLPSSDLPDLGPLGNFAQIGKQLVETPGPVTNTAFAVMTVVDGTLFSDSALPSEQSEVLSVSAALAALTPDQTISANQTGSLSYDVSPGQVEVVDLNGGLNLDNQSIMLAGGGSLVLNIKSNFSLDGSANILGDPFNIYINYEGASPVNSGTANTIDGLVFVPSAPANLEGNWNGGVYAMMSADPLTPIPEPHPTVLVPTALVSLLLARRRFYCKPERLRKSR